MSDLELFFRMSRRLLRMTEIFNPHIPVLASIIRIIGISVSHEAR